MKNVINIFSWIASALIEGISPGCLVMDNIIDGFKKYGESITKVAEAMQRSWAESIRTLRIALGENTLLSPKSRRQLAEKFAKEVITPFGVKHELTGKILEDFCKKALSQCTMLDKINDKIINFMEYEEQVLLENLVNVDKIAASSEEIGEIIIRNIQNEIPEAKELIELLWFRNLLMEGLVSHFSLELSYNPNLSVVVDRLDREKIQKDLDDIKQQITYAMNHKNFSDLTKLGAKATRLSTIDEVCELNERYQNLLGPVMFKLDQLSTDHEHMNDKLDDILKMLEQLQDMQKGRNHNLQNIFIEKKPSMPEEQLVNNINLYVDTIGWENLPENYRAQAVQLLTTSLCDLDRLSQSRELLEKLIGSGTKDANIYLTYFKMLQSVGEHDKAVKMYNQAVQLSKNLALFPPEKYQLIDIIAKGRTGYVYRALDIENNRVVAIKVFETFLQRREQFLKAVSIALSLSHENIIEVYEVSNAVEKHLWMAMEYIEGTSIQRKIQKEGPFSLEETIGLSFEIGKAIDYAHQNNIIHGDLKPQNIFYSKKGIKIGDFGLTQWKNSLLVTTNDIYASIYYAAPEKFIRENTENDVRLDVYSFGKTLYHFLTGSEPHDIEWDEVSESICQIIKKATRKIPEKRYVSISQMLEDILKINQSNDELRNENLTETGVFPVFYVRNKAINILPQYIRDFLPEGYEIVGQEIISPIDKAPMVYIPAGMFLMGDDSVDAELEEEPKHSVYLNAYLIDKYPVTNERYQKFLEGISQNPQFGVVFHEKTKLHIPQFWYHPKWNVENAPVVGVDWLDAQAYCIWAQKSLPLEAEWEKAARGTDGRYYPWGNEKPNIHTCNFASTTDKTSIVGSYPKYYSPYGCADMAGNVWEWCKDWYDPHYYNKSPFENPQGPSNSNFKVARGGSWKKNARKIRTTTRGYASVQERSNQIGFRTVKHISKRCGKK